MIRQGRKNKFAAWFTQAIDEGGFTIDELAAMRQRERKASRKRTEELEHHASGTHLPDCDTAYWLGKAIGTKLRFVHGPVGLYAAGYIGELIRLANELVPMIGASRAALVLAALPMIVDLGPPDGPDGPDISLARSIAVAIFSHAKNKLQAAWEALYGDSDGFSRRRRTELDEAIWDTYCIARTLEKSNLHTPHQIRDVCFGAVLKSLREYDLTPSAAEHLFDAAIEHQTWELELTRPSGHFHIVEKGSTHGQETSSRVPCRVPA